MRRTRASCSKKKLATLVSVGSTLALIALTTAAGLITRSVAILSDAVQSTADLLASLIAVLALERPSPRRMTDDCSDAPPALGLSKTHD